VESASKVRELPLPSSLLLFGLLFRPLVANVKPTPSGWLGTSADRDEPVDRPLRLEGERSPQSSEPTKAFRHSRATLFENATPCTRTSPSRRLSRAVCGCLRRPRGVASRPNPKSFLGARVLAGTQHDAAVRSPHTTPSPPSLTARSHNRAQSTRQPPAD